jgi:hypothetical protein
MIDLEKVKEIVVQEFPDDSINITPIDTSKKYKIVETVLNEKIAFRNISSGGSFGELSEDELASYLIETISLHKNIYTRLDRELIIKDKQTITYMNMSEPVSFHKLTPDELKLKVKEYDIKDDEFKKPNELPLKKAKQVAITYD